MEVNWLVASGSLCLGISIGALARIYIGRSEAFTLEGLVGVVSMLAGSGVLAIFHFIGGNTPSQEYWFYPIGLPLGFIIVYIVGRRSGIDFFGNQHKSDGSGPAG